MKVYCTALMLSNENKVKFNESQMCQRLFDIIQQNQGCMHLGLGAGITITLAGAGMGAGAGAY
jgi:hypothetical protein